MKTCSVIVPCRNEAANIMACIERMPRMGARTEIIFVEGHSTDDTWAAIEAAQARYGTTWAIRAFRQRGIGKGDAVRLGFEQATGDILIVLDADLTVGPEQLPAFFEAVASGRIALANGCRLTRRLNARAMPWPNQLANHLFAAIVSSLLGIRIRDSLCGTKAISRENYEKIAQNRAFFGDFDPFGDFDLLFGAAKLGLKIQDIAVSYAPRTYGKSNIHHAREAWKLLKMCVYAAIKLKLA